MYSIKLSTGLPPFANPLHNQTWLFAFIDNIIFAMFTNAVIRDYKSHYSWVEKW